MPVASADPIVAITTFQSSLDSVFAKDASQAVPGAGPGGEGLDATGEVEDEGMAEDIAVDAFPAPALELPTGGGEKVQRAPPWKSLPFHPVLMYLSDSTLSILLNSPESLERQRVWSTRRGAMGSTWLTGAVLRRW